MPSRDDTIRANTRTADAILVGRVASLGPPPPAWSGVFAAWQRVDYQIMRWLKAPEGRAPTGSLPVFHLVVAGTPTADPAAPRLRASIFHPGAELILFMRGGDPRWEVFDEHLGALPNEAPWLQQVEAALHDTGMPPGARP